MRIFRDIILLRNKISSKLETGEAVVAAADSSSSRGRGQGGRRGGRGRGKEEGEKAWSLKKYDFEDPGVYKVPYILIFFPTPHIFKILIFFPRNFCSRHLFPT